MFKSEAKLFLSANSNVNSAKALINECKRLIVDFDLEGNSDCRRFKKYINQCNIKALVTKIEDTKESLMKLDQGFASEYMTLLQEYLQTASIDTSNMTEEEKMQYSIQMRDYNQILLYMLEKYEEQGMLTDELRQQLLYQRELVAQYDIQDKMAVLNPDTDEYIALFKQNAEYDRKLIDLNPDLTPEQKQSLLEEYNTQYNKDLETLNKAKEERLKREKNEEELKELYQAKEDNNGLFHPFVESELDEAILDKKIEMGIASEDEISYKNMNGWDRFWTDTGTFVTSTFTGLYNVSEGITDGFVMLSSLVGPDEYKTWAMEYVSRDLSGETYQGIQLATGMNSYSAYGTYHVAGEAFAGFACKLTLSFTAPWFNALISGTESMGHASETSINNNEGYWVAMGKGFVSGISGAAEGYSYSKLNLGIRKFVSSGTLKTLGASALKNIKNLGAKLTADGGLKVVGGNLWKLAKTGAKALPKALGKAGVATIKDADALIETGCVIANNILDCAVSGEWDFDKLVSEAGGVFLVNYFMNFATGVAFDGLGKKTNNTYLQDINSDNTYRFDYNSEFNNAEKLRKLGLTDVEIAEVYAAQATKCANIDAKNDLYDFIYEYLAVKTNPSDAAKLVKDAFDSQLNVRGMTTVFVDKNGIKYNVINGFNSSNQAYNLKYVRKQVDSLPPQVKSSVKEINIYDTRCPADKYWELTYNTPDFYSAATGGGGKINIWANENTWDALLRHESAHCFDSNFSQYGSSIGKYSQSIEYIAAVQADFKLNGSYSVTSYGANNLGEDFADAFAMYKGSKMEGHSIMDFPNRKAFFDKIFNP